MTNDERFKQLEDVLVELLRKQDRTTEELAHLREGQSEINTKVVRMENRLERVEGRLERVENKLEDSNRNILELRRNTEKYQQETTADLSQIIELIRGLK